MWIFSNNKTIFIYKLYSFLAIIFDNPVDFEELTKATLILTGHIFIFFSIALVLFKRKDILT